MSGMRKAFACATAFAAGALAAGPAEDAEHIRNLADCFEVTYQFAEDGERDLFNTEHGLDGPIHERIDLERQSEDRYVLTHVSITPEGRAVPHWHEVWRFESEEQGWTQTVWSRAPDDPARERRYSCTAPWKMNRWQCHAGAAPKPFRDSGAPFGYHRTDYERLDRNNILLVTEEGWIHNERNKKIDSGGEIVAYELGWITYRRQPSRECETGNP